MTSQSTILSYIKEYSLDILPSLIFISASSISNYWYLFACSPPLPGHLKLGGGGGAYIISLLCLSVRYRYGFGFLSFKKAIGLDSCYIHSHIIIKYKSSLNWGKIHQLFWKLWPLFNNLIFSWKRVSFHYLLKILLY